MKKLPFTLCILTNRADDRMRKALESAYAASEILIIDNSSGIDWSAFKDVEHLKVHSSTDPITDFAAVRNDALMRATYDWVLFLDSDEVISLSSHRELEKFLAAPHAHGVSVIRSDIFYGAELQYGEAGRQPVVRLCNKHFCTFEQSVHERAVVRGKVYRSNIQIYHYSHTSISEFIDTISTYAQLIGAQKTTPRTYLILELIFFPIGKFFYGVFLQGGIFDGWRGIVYAACMSLHSLLVRAYAYEAHYRH